MGWQLVVRCENVSEQFYMMNDAYTRNALNERNVLLEADRFLEWTGMSLRDEVKLEVDEEG